MSLPGKSKASTPIGSRTRIKDLPRTGSSSSISPIKRTSSLEHRSKIRKAVVSASPDRISGLKRSGSPSLSGGNVTKRRKLLRSVKRKTVLPMEMETQDPPPNTVEDEDLETRDIEALRDAPQPLDDVENILLDRLDIPRLPITSIFDKHDKDTTIRADVSFSEVDDDDDSGELHVLELQKVYKGPGPRIWCRDCVLKKPSEDVYNFDFPNYEAERLWDKYFAADARKWCQEQMALKERTKRIRNREVMLRIRAENAEELKKVPKRKRKPRGRKKSETDRISSPEMITLHWTHSVDGPISSIVEGDSVEDHFDPKSRVNRREAKKHERKFEQGRRRHFPSSSNRIQGAEWTSEDDDEEDAEESDSSSRESSPDLLAEARARSRKRLPLTEQVLGLRRSSARIAAAKSTSEDHEESRRINEMVPGAENTMMEIPEASSKSNSGRNLHGLRITSNVNVSGLRLKLIKGSEKSNHTGD